MFRNGVEGGAHVFKDHVYRDWFLRNLLSPIDKYVACHFPQIEEESLQTYLRYDLIYVQSGYIYVVISNLPHPRGGNAMGESDITNGIIGTLSHPLPYTQEIYGYL